MHFINGKWREGTGENLVSHNPATNEIIWKGAHATSEEVSEAIDSAREALKSWRRLPHEERTEYLYSFEKTLKKRRDSIALAISLETGKPLWESKQEVDAMIGKVPLSIQAYLERCPHKKERLNNRVLQTRHQPHGVMAIFGPFNFPGHLPNGHIVPALLAGNTVIFKSSELTPFVAQEMLTCWDLPPGVLNLIQGGADTGHFLASDKRIDGICFTGSYKTGLLLLDLWKHHPEKIIALEMGGNNPLVVSNINNIKMAAQLIIQSAYLTTGQRCTCTRRLILLEGAQGDALIEELLSMISTLSIGPYNKEPPPFMGPVISMESALKLLSSQATLGALGGIPLLEMRPLQENLPFLTPGLMDVTPIEHKLDEEIFGPFLQVIRTADFESALEEAKKTEFGLVATLFSEKKEEFETFYHEVKAGIINWNCPSTGASSKAPFGGIGKSGNQRPSGYYAADYCSYPVASTLSEHLALS